MLNFLPLLCLSSLEGPANLPINKSSDEEDSDSESESSDRNAVLRPPAPPMEELAKMRWLSSSIPVYGQIWIGVKHPFIHEKYVLFRSVDEAKKWALSLTDTLRRSTTNRPQFHCTFSPAIDGLAEPANKG